MSKLVAAVAQTATILFDTPATIERAFDLDEQFRHVDRIFDRVFQTEEVRA